MLYTSVTALLREELRTITLSPAIAIGESATSPDAPIVLSVFGSKSVFKRVRQANAPRPIVSTFVSSSPTNSLRIDSCIGS